MNRFTAAVLTATVSLTAFAGTALSEPRTYAFDRAHSEVGFDIRHFFNKTHGRFNDYSGSLVFDENNVAASSVEVAINDSSIYTGNERRDNDLRGENFFWAAKYPKVTFKSTKVTPGATKERFQVAGDLTIRDVTKPVVLDVEYLGSAPIKLKGPDGSLRDLGHQAGFIGKVTVNRKDFGIVWNQTMDTGGMMLADDVDITLNIAAVSRPPAPPAGGAGGPAPGAAPKDAPAQGAAPAGDKK
jgi:polyisoprenoid-binding protein YceI